MQPTARRDRRMLRWLVDGSRGEYVTNRKVAYSTVGAEFRRSRRQRCVGGHRLPTSLLLFVAPLVARPPQTTAGWPCSSTPENENPSCVGAFAQSSRVCGNLGFDCAFIRNHFVAHRTPPCPRHQCQTRLLLPQPLRSGCLRSKAPPRIAVRLSRAAASPPTATRSAAACAHNRTTPFRCASTCACARSKGAPRAQWSARAVTRDTTKRGTENTPAGTTWQPTCAACACKTRRATYLSTPAAGIWRVECSAWATAVAVSVPVWPFSSSRGS